MTIDWRALLRLSGFHLVVFNVIFIMMYGLAWIAYDSVMAFHGWLIVCNGVFFLVILPYLTWENRQLFYTSGK